MESQLFNTILDECLLKIKSGMPLEECLRTYPQSADELRPLLYLAASISQITLPVQAKSAVDAGRERMLQRAQILRPDPVPGVPAVSFAALARYTKQLWSSFKGKEKIGMKTSLRFGISALLALILISTMLVNASAASLPGDLLYGVKTGWESTRLGLTTNQAQREMLQAELIKERHHELVEMIQKAHAGIVTIVGEVQVISPGTIVINGITITVADEKLLVEIKKGDVVTATIEVSKDSHVLLVGIDPTEVVLPPDLKDKADNGVFWPTIDESKATWVTPIPYWETYQPTEWRTLVPTEYHTLVPTGIEDQWPTLVSTYVPTQWKTYVPTDLPGLVTMIPTLPPNWATNMPGWETVVPALQTAIPNLPTMPSMPTGMPSWPTANPNPNDYPTVIPDYIETKMVPPQPPPPNPNPPPPPPDDGGDDGGDDTIPWPQPPDDDNDNPFPWPLPHP